MANPDADTQPERSRDLDRLLTFIDAIVAIAITLLVLPLADLGAEISDGDSVWQTVRDHSGQFGGFVLSFVVIARLWMAQHRVVRGATDSDRGLAGGLILWTLTIVFLPFPTALLADVGSQAATKVFYIGTLALSSTMLALVALTVRRQLPADAPIRPRVAPAAIDAVLFAAALGLCLLLPALSYYPLFLLFLAGPIERVLRRRLQRELIPRQAGRA